MRAGDDIAIFDNRYARKGVQGWRGKRRQSVCAGFLDGRWQMLVREGETDFGEPIEAYSFDSEDRCFEAFFQRCEALRGQKNSCIRKR